MIQLLIIYYVVLALSLIHISSVAVLSIGTRTDCFSTEIYDLLSELNKIKPVWIELGLQTIHRSTLDAMNTHTCVEDFIIVTDELRRRGIKVIAHLILGLPHETRGMMLESCLLYTSRCV